MLGYGYLEVTKQRLKYYDLYPVETLKVESEGFIMTKKIFDREIMAELSINRQFFQQYVSQQYPLLGR